MKLLTPGRRDLAIARQGYQTVFDAKAPSTSKTVWKCLGLAQLIQASDWLKKWCCRRIGSDDDGGTTVA